MDTTDGPSKKKPKLTDAEQKRLVKHLTARRKAQRERMDKYLQKTRMKLVLLALLEERTGQAAEETPRNEPVKTNSHL